VDYRPGFIPSRAGFGPRAGCPNYPALHDPCRVIVSRFSSGPPPRGAFLKLYLVLGSPPPHMLIRHGGARVGVFLFPAPWIRVMEEFFSKVIIYLEINRKGFG